MSEKLYLLRRNHEHLHGPYNLTQLSRIYKVNKHSSEIEVSGNLGPWVYARNINDLGKYYPELLDTFHAGDDATQYASAYTKITTVPVRRSRFLPNLILITILLGIVGGLTFVLLRKININRHLQKAMHAYSKERDYQRALAIIESKPQLVTELLDRSKDSSYWLPLLRTLTFYGNSNTSLFALHLVKGNNAINTPDDCSEANWEKIWTTSTKSWEEFLVQQNLIDAHWAMLLSWDSHWIRTYQSPGWQEPKSYAQGCLLSAYDSFTTAFLPEDKKDLAALINARITWLSHALSPEENQPTTAVATDKSHPLLIWNCMEQSTTMNELNTCINYIKTLPSTQLTDYTHEKYVWNKLRIMLATGIEPEDIVNYTDTYNSIDYSPILKLSAELTP